MFIFIVKLVNLLFSVRFATGYIHSGEIKIFNTWTTIEWIAIRRSKHAFTLSITLQKH